MLQLPRETVKFVIPRFGSYRLASSNSLTIGLRREDPGRLWERRCPLTPDAIEELVNGEAIRVIVQDCNRRVFGVDEFRKAGAIIQNDLSTAHIILGIKEVPLTELAEQSGPITFNDALVSRTHLMFSHTGKGQLYNMPLLSKFVRSGYADKDRLVDYEFLTDESGKRVVAFGWFAGAAGAVEGLCASAHDFLSFGVASPFLNLPRPYMSGSIEKMRQSLRDVGDHISERGTPSSTGPFVIAVTGNGNVAQGAMSVLRELPHTNVLPEDLPKLVLSEDTDLSKVYIVHVKPEHYLVPANGSLSPFDRASYYARPSEWKSVFHDKIAPYTTLLINGTGWKPGFPRLMTNAQMAQARLASHKFSGHGRFRTVADVSCDVKGGLEFMERSTTIDSPFYTAHSSLLPSDVPGVQIMSVDILPTQIPRDASAHFSAALTPYLRTLIRQYQGRLTSDDKDRLRVLDRATITQNGKLQSKFDWLATPLKSSRGKAGESSSSDDNAKLSSTPETIIAKTPILSHKRKILLLGSGMVARPAIEEFSKRGDVRLVVASNNVSEAGFLKEHFPTVTAKQLDLEDLTTLNNLVNEADIVVSLLPVPYHPTVAKVCIGNRKHMVTASYISPAMRALNQSALEADVLLLNEIGLDPGIDHCSAISLLQRLRSQKNTVKSFISFCGGLPTPETADVPLGYKFSWSPRGVLGAALNEARFKLLGTEFKIPGNDLLQSYFPSIPQSKFLKLEGIANRDSLPYAETYDLGPLSSLDTVLRGTLRYPGFCSLMHSFHRIGLLETDRTISINNWSSFAPRALASKFAIPLAYDDPMSFQSILSDILGMPNDKLSELLQALSWLGISPMPSRANTFSHSKHHSIPVPVPSKQLAPIDLLTMILSHRLQYQPNERDMVVLMHEITVLSEPPFSQLLPPSSGQSDVKTYTSTLVAYGSPTSTAMSRTVGIPVALAALAVLDGGVSSRGVHGPTMPEVYLPVLQGLEANGLGMKESVVIGAGSGKSLKDGLGSTLGVQ
ncbi:Saccharopine dehydrogenase-domain-containing protein [Hysterangium stoloniferum]|nr:Saccharopine dehydrogenase-domain-containing protein [Hysterangium stoloniferum]